MDNHIRQNEDDPDNLFDFVLLPGTVNARRGMKTAAPETIPCKYGNSCFRKDCRFSHASDLYTGPAGNNNNARNNNSYRFGVNSSKPSYNRERSLSPSEALMSEPNSPPRMEERQRVVMSMA